MATRSGRRLNNRWPRWNRPCDSMSWRTGQPCKAPATRGYNRCKKHGGGGINKEKAWKRYLLWVLLPDTIRHNKPLSPFTEEEVEIVCNILAQYCVTGDSHATEGVRMQAIEYLFESMTLEAHPRPADLLTHLSEEDAIETVRVLRRNGLLK